MFSNGVGIVCHNKSRVINSNDQVVVWISLRISSTPPLSKKQTLRERNHLQPQDQNTTSSKINAFLTHLLTQSQEEVQAQQRQPARGQNHFQYIPATHPQRCTRVPLTEKTDSPHSHFFCKRTAPEGQVNRAVPKEKAFDEEREGHTESGPKYIDIVACSQRIGQHHKVHK